ncbi:hypothetical protein [Shewanella algae]|uniref:hypothetical protein n=1 Tax=Shewanella algae TaxID=38313 RepID=UPI001AACF1A8|nr:hypothetical protein [Shewanella algae]MBO2600011.1 hypothetical protein [Shewanella algae]
MTTSSQNNTIRRLALKLRNNRQRLAALYLRWILPQGVNRSLEAELLGLTVRRVHEFRSYDADSDTMTDVQRRLTFDQWIEQQELQERPTGGNVGLVLEGVRAGGLECLDLFEGVAVSG